MKHKGFLFPLTLGLTSALLILFSLLTTPSSGAQGAILPPQANQPAAINAAPDIGVNKWHLGGFARPGGKIVYGIVYWNDGDAVAADVIITDTLPVSTTWAGDTSGLTPDIGANGVITWDIGNLPDEGLFGHWGVFAVTLDVDANMPTGEGALDANCATISTSTPGDANPDDNTSCTNPVDVWDSDVSINVDKWPNPNDPTPGQEFEYTIQWCTDYGANFGPVWLTDTLPVSTTFVNWSTEWPWNMWTEVITTGGQFALYAPGLPGDWCQHINLRLLLDPNAPQGMMLNNHVIVETPDDAQPDNNERLNQDAYVSAPRYDLHLDKSMHRGVLVPGGWINYIIQYNNQGNIETPVVVTETVSAGLTFDSAYWGGGQPGENEPLPDPTIDGDQVVWDLDELSVNGSRWFHVQMTVTDTLGDDAIITNCAVIGPDGEESTPEDNESCYSVMLNPSGPNLRVTKEHWWNGDGQLGYRIYFFNLGDETISDAWITDTLPTGTTWDGWWNLGFDQDRLAEEVLDSDVLAWRFSELYPGDAGNIEFNANLDDPGVPMRWFTNTVEITALLDETTPADNTYTDVAFSGGEVRRAEMWLGTDHANMWGEGVPGPVTITTPYTEVVVWGDPGCNGCWNTEDLGPIWPGDTVVVEAGDGLLPVTIAVPDPFDVDVDSASDTVWGEIAGAANQPVQIHGYWPSGFRETQMNAQGEYSVTYPDVPRGAQGHVRYQTMINYADVMFHRRFQSPDLLISVDYSNNGVDANYEPGHTGWVTVTNATGTEIKATVEVTTAAWPWWGGNSGFSTHHHEWSPAHPDIQPGDWVYAALDNGYTTAIQVGTINATVDVDNDTVSGTLDVPWHTEGLHVTCEIHEENAPGIQIENVDPQGGAFFCDFSGMWDITPGQNVVVRYTEPDGDAVLFRPANPAPHLRVEKWLEGGNPAEGSNAVFYMQYRNEGDAPAEDVVITDTLQGMTFITDTSGFASTGGGNQVVWDLGTVEPGDWIHFNVFVEVTATAGERITNTVEIATTNPYDQGNEWERRAEWSGDVLLNDTRLNVGKWAWTGDPAPGYDVVFAVNTCNFGSTASAEVVLIDTLHPSLTLQTWWGQNPGWVEVSRSDHELVISRPTIAGGWCNEVYVQATVDAEAWPGMTISNTATIYAANDLTDDDNETWWWGGINEPHTNLNINKNWGSGQLVPGGELHYWINVHNNGNIPVGTFRITDTLPVSTTFHASWQRDQYGQEYPFPPLYVGDGYVVWEFAGLDNGFGDNFEIVLDVDPNALPGTVLVNTAEVTRLPGEDTYDDNVSVWTETLFEHGPNLRVRKDGQWDNWGENTRRASYNLNVENVGDVRVAMVTITDTYPAGMHLDGGIGGGFWRWWDWKDNGDHFTITLEMLEPGWAVGFNFGLITDTEPLPFGLIFTNTAEVMLVQNDTNPDDNIDTAILTTGPDLWVEKELSGGDLLPGELITFTLRFGNDRYGHEWWWNMQGNAILTDTLPAGLEFVSAQLRWCESSEWCDFDPTWEGDDQAVWELWPLNAGDWNEILVTVRITDTATGLDTFTNHVEIGSTEPVSDTEPYYTNNHAMIDLPIDMPFFEVSKAYESTAIAGMPIAYTLTVTNTGNSIGTGIILSDTIPAGLEYVSGGSLLLPWVWWQIDSLAPNGGVAMEMFQATLPCQGAVVNNDYRVADSDQGVTSEVGAPVAVTVLAPTLVADFDQSATMGLVNTTFYFTSTSTSNGPAITAWAWDFGDGQSATGSTANHTYTTDGAFTVRLTITDTCGYSDSYQSTVQVNTGVQYIFLPLVLRNS